MYSGPTLHAPPKPSVVNCYECAALLICPGRSKQPTEARSVAQSCKQLFKGRPTDVVPIQDQSRGISLKRALQATQKGLAKWADNGELVLLNALLIVKEKRTKIVPASR